MIIGDRLRALREAKKLSQGDVEKRTGLLRAYISRVETGHTVPAIETLEKMAKALRVPLYQLFYDGKEPPKLPNLPKPGSVRDSAWVRIGNTRKDRASSWSRTLLMLETQGNLDKFDPKPLGKLVDAIVKEGSKRKSREALQQWLDKYADSWLI